MYYPIAPCATISIIYKVLSSFRSLPHVKLLIFEGHGFIRQLAFHPTTTGEMSSPTLSSIFYHRHTGHKTSLQDVQRSMAGSFNVQSCSKVSYQLMIRDCLVQWSPFPVGCIPTVVADL